MRISDWSSDVCSSDLGTRRNLLPGRENHLTRISVDDVEGWLLSTPRFGAERNLPTAFTANEGHGVIEGVENFLAVKAQSIEQSGHRQLALPVNEHIELVLGAESETKTVTRIGTTRQGVG